MTKTSNPIELQLLKELVDVLRKIVRLEEERQRLYREIENLRKTPK